MDRRGARMTLYVDTRYQGQHGIGRYATEVLARLDLDWQPLPVSGNPTSPSAVVDRGWRVPRQNDLIYSPGFGSGFSAARQVLTIHDLIHRERPVGGGKAFAHRLYYDRVVKPAVKRAGLVFTVSATSATSIRNWLRDDTVDIVVTGNGASETFRMGGPAHAQPRPYVLYVGNAKEHKNPAMAMDTIALLPGFDLICVSGDVTALRGIADSAGVADRVQIVSGVDDATLAAYYRGAVALIMPSLLEGFGLPALEASRCGTPVVHYRGCDSVVEIVDCPDLAMPNDARAYASVISDIHRGQLRSLSDTANPTGWADVAARVQCALANSR